MNRLIVSLGLCAILLSDFSNTECLARGALFEISRKTRFEFRETPIQDACKYLAAIHRFPVFLESGINVKLNANVSSKILGEALEEVLKPHRLHFHAAITGLYITKKPVPFNATYLPGNYRIELPIPQKRQLDSLDDFSICWLENPNITTVERRFGTGADIVIRWESLGKETTQAAVEKRISSLKKYASVTELKEYGKGSLKKYVIRYIRPATVTILDKELKLRSSPYINDLVIFQNGPYLYRIHHSFPESRIESCEKISLGIVREMKLQKQNFIEFKR